MSTHNIPFSREYSQYTILIEVILMSTHNIPFSIYKKKITHNYPKSAALGFFSKGLYNEFETAVVNEPSVFEPLKFCCNYLVLVSRQIISSDQ